MKRKLVFCVVFGALVFFSFAEAKHYEDFWSGFKGDAVAAYEGKSGFEIQWDRGLEILQQTLISEEFIFSMLHKLSKEESWLLWQALGEYEYKDGEVYSVYISSQTRELYLLVRITNNKESCNFHCAILTGRKW